MKINIVLLGQHLLAWFLRQPKRLQFWWTKNKQVNDILEKWDRQYESYLKDASYNSQTLSIETFLSKKVDDFYKLYPLQGDIITGVTGTSFTGNTDLLQVNGDGVIGTIMVEIQDVLSRDFILGDRFRFQGYVQPQKNDTIPWIVIEDEMGEISDRIGLSGGWNDVEIQIDSSASGTTYLTLVANDQNYYIQDLNIFYAKSADIVIRDRDRTPDPYIAVTNTGTTATPYEYPTFSDDYVFNLSLSGTSNITLTGATGTTFSDVIHLEGSSTDADASIFIETDCLLNWTEQVMVNYGNLFMTGNTDVSIKLIESDGTLVENNNVYTFLSSDILLYDYSGITNSGSTEKIYIEVNFGTPVDFSMDLQFQLRGGFFYTNNPATNIASALGYNFIIYIDDRDDSVEMRNYLSSEIDTKRPATATYTYLTY